MTSIRLLDLPYELLQHVLRCGTYVDNTNNTAEKEKSRFLGVCRLTCRVLNIMAAPMMFQIVQLGSVSDWYDPESLDHVRVFRDLLDVNIQIATYIQSFSIITNDCHDFFQSPDIEVILSRLKCLRHFSLRVFAVRPKLRWSQITEAQAAALKTICSLPCLTTIEFAGIHGLPLLQLLENSINLERLILRHLYLDLDDYSSLPPTAKLKSLRLLNVKTSKSKLQSLELHDISLFKSLENFHVYFSSGESIEQARMIIKVAQTTLKVLHFLLPWHTINSESRDNWTDRLSSGLYNHPLSSLEKITIEESSARHASGQLPAYIPHLLDLAEEKSTVQSVHIYASAPYYTAGHTQDSCVWIEVDRILQEKYPTLRELTLECNDHTFRHQDPKQVHDAIQAVKLLFKGVIETRTVSVRLGIMPGFKKPQIEYLVVA